MSATIKVKAESSDATVTLPAEVTITGGEATAHYVDHESVAYPTLHDLLDAHGLTHCQLRKYNDPTDDARDGLTEREAIEIARVDSGLVYLG